MKSVPTTRVFRVVRVFRGSKFEDIEPRNTRNTRKVGRLERSLVGRSDFIGRRQDAKKQGFEARNVRAGTRHGKVGASA